MVQIKLKPELKNRLRERLSTTWGIILVSLAIFFLSAYLPPPLRLLLWVLFMFNLLAPIVRGVIREMRIKD